MEKYKLAKRKAQNPVSSSAIYMLTRSTAEKETINADIKISEI